LNSRPGTTRFFFRKLELLNPIREGCGPSRTRESVDFLSRMGIWIKYLIQIFIRYLRECERVIVEVSFSRSFLLDQVLDQVPERVQRDL
jgi:hypothetical protein